MAGPSAECVRSPQADTWGGGLFIWSALCCGAWLTGICYLLRQTDCSVATVLSVVA